MQPFLRPEVLHQEGTFWPVHFVCRRRVAERSESGSLWTALEKKCGTQNWVKRTAHAEKLECRSGGQKKYKSLLLSCRAFGLVLGFEFEL